MEKEQKCLFISNHTVVNTTYLQISSSTQHLFNYFISWSLLKTSLSHKNNVNQTKYGSKYWLNFTYSMFPPYRATPNFIFSANHWPFPSRRSRSVTWHTARDLFVSHNSKIFNRCQHLWSYFTPLHSILMFKAITFKIDMDAPRGHMSGLLAAVHADFCFCFCFCSWFSTQHSQFGHYVEVIWCDALETHRSLMKSGVDIIKVSAR